MFGIKASGNIRRQLTKAVVSKFIENYNLGLTSYDHPTCRHDHILRPKANWSRGGNTYWDPIGMYRWDFWSMTRPHSSKDQHLATQSHFLASKCLNFYPNITIFQVFTSKIAEKVYPRTLFGHFVLEKNDPNERHMLSDLSTMFPPRVNSPKWQNCSFSCTFAKHMLPNEGVKLTPRRPFDPPAVH